MIIDNIAGYKTATKDSFINCVKSNKGILNLTQDRDQSEILGYHVSYFYPENVVFLCDTISEKGFDFAYFENGDDFMRFVINNDS